MSAKYFCRNKRKGRELEGRVKLKKDKKNSEKDGNLNACVEEKVNSIQFSILGGIYTH